MINVSHSDPVFVRSYVRELGFVIVLVLGLGWSGFGVGVGVGV